MTEIQRLLDIIEDPNNSIQTGDIILQYGVGDVSEAVKLYDRGNYSHARLYCGKDENGEHITIEMTLESNLVEQGLVEGFKNAKAKIFRLFRHKLIDEYPNKKQMLVEKAKKYIGNAEYGSKNHVDMFAKILSMDYLVANLRNPQYLRKIYEKAFYLLVREKENGRHMFTCSGFIYQVFEDVALSIDIESERFKTKKTYRGGDKDSVIYREIPEAAHVTEKSYLNYLIENKIVEREILAIVNTCNESDEIFDEEFFLGKLNEQNLIEEESENIESILNQLILDFETAEEDKVRKVSHRGAKLTPEREETLKKMLMSRSLYLMTFSWFSKYPLKDLKNIDLKAQKSIFQFFKEYLETDVESFDKHTFATPADLAISASLKDITPKISVNYEKL